MKIFNWVHRRFANKEGMTESGKKSCVIDGDGEGETSNYVGDNNALKVFDGWKQGILTIGTLGYDPLKQKDECFDEAEEENESHAELIISDSEEESEDEDETNPLVYLNDCEEYLEIKRDIGNGINGEEFELELEFDAMIKKERITLAELFSADTDLEKLQMEKEAINEKGEVMKEEDYKSSNYKTGFSFSKNKKLTAGDKDARPIHKLHRMMRMMLKRKIHPDEGMNSTKIGDNIGTETTSLLPSQDAII